MPGGLSEKLLGFSLFEQLLGFPECQRPRVEAAPASLCRC